jgi:tetratricopeptide (TPR) repeat protein
VVARPGRTPIIEHSDEPPLGDVRLHLVFRQIGEAASAERCLKPQGYVVEHPLPLDTYLHFTPAFLEFPGVESAVSWQAKIDARMESKILRFLRRPMVCKVRGRTHDSHAKVRADAHGNHVSCHLLAKTNPSVVALRHADTRISGEITAEHPSATGVGGKDEKSLPKKFSIRLRISDKGHVQYEAEADKLETLVEQAALKLVERFHPLEAAYYSYCKRDYDNALRIVRAYLAKQTKNERQWALNLLGLIEHARYEYDEARAEKGYNNAVAVFTELRTSDLKFASALYNLSFVLIDKGKKHLKDEDGEVARALLSQAYEVAREGIAINEVAAKRRNSISLVLSGSPADTTARELAVGYATAGRALRFLGQLESANYDQALRYFDRSIGADPTFMYAYFSQGAIHNELAAHDNAIARYQLATEINPSAQIFTRAGAYLRKYERHIDSIQMFQKAAELKPSANAYAYWGMALRASGRPEEARERFQRAIDTDPSSPNGYNQLGLMYLEQQKWDEAVENFLQAIRLSPQWSNYYYNLSRAFRGAGKVKEATDAMKKAIEIYRSHSKARMELEELELQQRGAVTRSVW